MEVDSESKQEANKKISFRFCRECSNLLYPKEDTHNDKLMFACRTCDYTEEATSDCVYRNSLQEQIAETAGNIEDVAQDPTVGEESYSVPALDSFMSDTYYDEDDDDREPDTCTYCGKEIRCPFCGGATDGGLSLEVADPTSNLSREQEEDMIEAEKRERALSTTARTQSSHMLPSLAANATPPMRSTFKVNNELPRLAWPYSTSAVAAPMSGQRSITKLDSLS